MEDLVDVFSNNQVLILGIVMFIFGIILLGYLLTILITNNKKKTKEVVKVENKDVKQEENKIQSTETTKQEANEQIIDNHENITNQLEEMLNKMQKTLDEKQEMDEIANFEKEQEETAIISYQELLKAAKKDFPKMNLVENEDEQTKDSNDNKIISNVEEQYIIKAISSPKEEFFIESKEEVMLDLKTEETFNPINSIIKDDNQLDDKKFKSSVFISPIGITDNENPNYYKEVRIRKDYLKEMADSRFNTVDIQTDSLEYKEDQNEQFLEDLKNFRNNL